MSRAPLVTLAFVLTLGAPSASRASFHDMKIREVYAGADAQYVMLQMFFSGQNFVGGHSLILYDAAGTAIQTDTFGGMVASGNDQDTILIGTAGTFSAFGIMPDLTMPSAVLSAAGGKACWDTTLIDCVAWGSHSGSATGVGSPAAP